MLVIPAIDLRAGRCVRLLRGDPSQETVFGADPAEVARGFRAAGASRLHVVDLDGAFAGHPVSLATVRAIVAEGIPVELGGGLRHLDDLAAAFAAGVHWAILGTAAVAAPGFVAEACRLYPGQILVGLDARGGKLATAGWAKATNATALSVAQQVGAAGVTEVIYTDISQDGTLAGPNVAATRELARRSGLRVIASGGVGSLGDLQALRTAEADGVCGAVVGRAIYTGALDLAAAIREVAS